MEGEKTKSPSGLQYAEKTSLIQMFELSQQVFFKLLGKLIKKNAVKTMFLKTLERSMEKHRDVLKKVDCDHKGNVRIDGSLEIGRLIANVNSLSTAENEKDKHFFEALRDIFEERLIATELAVGIETKDELMSNILMQTEQIFLKKDFEKSLKIIFMKDIVPSTTIDPGDN